MSSLQPKHITTSAGNPVDRQSADFNSMPLYDELLKCQYRTVNLSIISQLQKDQSEVIYACIIHYMVKQIINAPNNSVADKSKSVMDQIYGQLSNVKDLPFGMKMMTGGKGVLISIHNLPEELRIVIGNYLLYVIGQTH